MPTLNIKPTTTLRVPGRRTTAGFDLVLPCYNPPAQWVSQLTNDFFQLRTLLPHVSIQLILVIDGPALHVTDENLQLLQFNIPGVKVINHPVNRGKGYALRLGVAIGTSPCQVCTDIDFPFGASAIADAYDQLQHGADVVAGVRSPSYSRLLPKKRRIISNINRLLNRHLLNLKVIDAQAGLKAFNKKGREAFLATHVNGFLFDSEFVHRAGKKGTMVISTVRIHCKQGIRFSEFKSKVLWRELMNFFAILFIS